ncbi:hypothetical protein ABIE51_000660 [Lysobacter sp. OAE881]|uniref:TniB family NTP-binding protein n=1 Tax=Lysobacter TaxID=68 RepID=UPI00178A8253|nr:TniB family NTP-binding protein [Lysobacter soli]MDG2517198.1 TniB family NTP-binding protein [Lysobacter soli]
MSAKKEDLRKYRDVVQTLRVEHAAYTELMEELKAAYDDIGLSAVDVCLIVLGEPRTGKSSVATDMLDERVAKQSADSLTRNVVYAVAPSPATVKSLLECLLYGLGDPHWNRGTVSSMTQRLYTLLKAAKCRMIILDEFQHLCAVDGSDSESATGAAGARRPHRSSGAVQRQKATADWLKVLLETTGIGFVAVGLPHAASVIQSNRQLSGRFDPPLRLPVFDWCEDASRAQFLGILQQFQKGLEPFQFPPFDSDAMGLRMYLASAGRIGLLAKFLDRAVRNAIRAKTVQIRLEDLAEAYRASIWSAPLFPVKGGPFGADFSALQLRGVQEQVLADASKEPCADVSGAVKVYGDSNVQPSCKPGPTNKARPARAPKPPRKKPRARSRGSAARKLAGVL